MPRERIPDVGNLAVRRASFGLAQGGHPVSGEPPGGIQLVTAFEDETGIWMEYRDLGEGFQEGIGTLSVFEGGDVEERELMRRATNAVIWRWEHNMLIHSMRNDSDLLGDDIMPQQNPPAELAGRDDPNIELADYARQCRAVLAAETRLASDEDEGL